MHILAEPLDVGVGRLVLQPFTSGGITTMMGIKERNFRPLPDDLSLEVMVPRDNFYRRLGRGSTSLSCASWCYLCMPKEAGTRSTRWSSSSYSSCFSSKTPQKRAAAHGGG